MPKYNIDLSHWKLTLPDKTPPTEIKPSELIKGWSHPEWFKRGKDGELIFACPVTGGHTLGSSYPRTELRELINGQSDRVNWQFGGIHSLSATCSIDRVPSSKKVIIGQIHGKDGTSLPLFKLVYNKGKLVAEFKKSPTDSSDIKYEMGSISLGKSIKYEIKANKLDLTITVNGKSRKVKLVPEWLPCTFYFKAGCYCIDNQGNEWAQVTFYDLVAKHA